MKRFTLPLAALALVLLVLGAASVNYTNTVPNLLVRTNAAVTAQLTVAAGAEVSTVPLHIGNSKTNQSVDAQVLISRVVTNNVSGNGHGFSDSSYVSRNNGGPIGYNSYDARVKFGGGYSYDHYAAFQANPDFNNSGGGVSKYYGLYSKPNPNLGWLTNVYHFYAANPGVGAVQNLYGLYLEDLTRGLTSNWGIYQVGSASNYFGGAIQAATGVSAASGAFTSSLTLGGNPVLTNVTESIVTNALGMNLTGLLSEKAPLANPTFTGTINADSMDLSGTLAVDVLALPLTEGHVRMTISGGTTNLANVDATEEAAMGVLATNTFTGTGRIVLESEVGGSVATYAVGALPAAASNTGKVVWCTDNITALGTAGLVFSDGTNWRNQKEGTVVTTSVPAFIMACRSVGLNYNTALSDIEFGYSLTIPGASTIIGGPMSLGIATADGLVVENVLDGGIGLTLYTGASATGKARVVGYNLAALSAGQSLACGASCYVDTLCDGSETYWCLQGFHNSASVGYPTSGAFFLYDCYDVNSHGQAYTNNWICATAQAGYTYADSGLPVSTTTAASLSIILTTTSAVFYTNGVQCASIATTLPTTALVVNKQEIVKTVGTTGRRLYTRYPFYHSRASAARTF